MAKTNTIIWIVAVVIILLILGYVAYTRMQTSAPATTPKDNSQVAGVHNIEISNFAFSAPSLIIKQGDTVVWTNKDSAPHTVTSDTGNELSSKLLKTNEVYSHTFDTAGTFDYHCEVHPMMKASITVQ